MHDFFIAFCDSEEASPFGPLDWTIWTYHSTADNSVRTSQSPHHLRYFTAQIGPFTFSPPTVRTANRQIVTGALSLRFRLYVYLYPEKKQSALRAIFLT